MSRIGEIFRGSSYYAVLAIASLVLVAVTKLWGFDRLFYLLYEVNYAGINTAVMTFFGILFAFIFTILAILFGLRDDSLFLNLVHKNKRNKTDIVNYFSFSIVLLAAVLVISLFLTVTYVGAPVTMGAELQSALSGIAQPTQLLIYLLAYLIEMSLVSVVLLLITFMAIIRT